MNIINSCGRLLYELRLEPWRTGSFVQLGKLRANNKQKQTAAVVDVADRVFLRRPDH